MSKLQSYKQQVMKLISGVSFGIHPDSCTDKPTEEEYERLDELLLSGNAEDFTKELLRVSFTFRESFADSVGIPEDNHATTKTHKGYVYLAESGNKYKIGFSRCVPGRMAQHFGSNPDIRLIAKKEGTMSVEAQLHRKFAHLRVSGTKEWFRKSREVLNEFKDDSSASGCP